MPRTPQQKQRKKQNEQIEWMGDLLWKAITLEKVESGVPRARWQTWQTNAFMRAACVQCGIQPIGGASFERHIARLWMARQPAEIIRIMDAVCL